MRFLALLITSAAFVTASVNITPDRPPAVAAGGVLHLKANVPVTWSLAPGSPGKIDQDGTYHAPSTIPVKNMFGGCQLLGNDHVFNTRIDSLPLDPHSAEWMALIPPSKVGYYPGWGINIADQTTPKKKMHFFYTPQNDGDFEMVQWPQLKREGGVFTDSNSPIDRHQTTIDRQTCQIFELYSAYEPGKNKSCPTCTAQSGFQYNSLSPELPSGSIDASGLLMTPLTLGLEEIRSGAIQHALRFTLKNNIIAPRSVWPARTNAGAWGKIPYGTRFRLKAGFDTSHFSAYAQVLLKQLKLYGLILADGGGNFDVSAFTDVTEDPTVEGALGEVWGNGPRSSDFEIVDESPLMGSPSLGSVKADSEYATPDGYASVIAVSKEHNSEVGRTRIVFAGVTVGVPDPAEWVQSGVSLQFKSWVNGTAEKAVRWSMDPPLGTLSPDGHYTAPNVERPTNTLLKVASAVDPGSSAKVALTVLPKGAIRIAVGNATKAPGAANRSYPDYGPDSNGDMWWRGQAGENSWGVVVDDWYGQPWPKAKDIQLYYTSRYSLGDMVYSFQVPNGRYQITLLFAQPQCKTTFPKTMRVPFHLETQGKIEIPNFDMGAGIGDACLAPVSESMPALVTDNSLYFALRRVSSGKDTPSPILSAFSITKDDSPAHLSVTPAKVASLTIGQQIKFKTVGWQMGDAATWSVVKGPGTVSPDGVYSAPASPPKEDQTIVLQAKSASDPSKTATAEMVLKFGDFTVTPAKATLIRSLSTQLTPQLDGVNYSNVNWSLQPSVGKIAADGTYTAPDHLPSDTTVTVTAQSKDVADKSASALITLKAKPGPMRIDCGATGPFTDAQGNVWAADYGFSSPSMGYHENAVIARASSDMQSLYQSARYRYANQAFSYKFPLPNGKYSVTLKFADYTFKEAGHYNFDVVLNGEKVLKNFDFDTVYGPRTAVDKKFETTVTDKMLTIDFIGHNQGASVNGLEIVYLGEGSVSP